MIVGITFTYFSFLSREKEDSTRVVAGTLAINYIDGDVINSTGLIPCNEPSINSNFGVYKKRFSVRSSGTLDQNLDIFIKVDRNDFEEGNLRYAIYDDNNSKIGTGVLPKSGSVMIASSDYLLNNSTNNYMVIIWLQNINVDQGYEVDSLFVGSFDITANQVKFKQTALAVFSLLRFCFII